MSVENSVFDSLADLTVSDILTSSELLEAAAAEQLIGTQAYDLLFSPEDVDSMAVAYNLDVAPALDEAVQQVAEFGEIPVGDPSRGPRKTAELSKLALGLRVSWEQRNIGAASGTVIQRELVSRLAEIRRRNSADAVAALEAAGIEELTVDAKWTDEAAKAADDLFAADDLLASAVDANGNKFNYSAGFVWGNRRTLNGLKRNDQVVKMYTGDMASKNPLFADVANQPLIAEQFQLVADQALPDGVVYVFAGEEYGKVGTRFQIGGPRFTDWYSERGQSELGGATMAFRSDYVHFRHLAVRAPKAIVKLVGAI
ncbi:hypothetical protein [Corynebacterium ulceribovis]|uniref:hypothetical protein n=1 Tax=Corynebacterium ulceribovis TaxID=487732 RepID=UPI0003658AC5|nr:hypothetical protein [Corynebacterium ulceribovis]